MPCKIWVVATHEGAIHVGIDINDWLDIVVADGAEFGSGGDGGHVAQNLLCLQSAVRSDGGGAAGRLSGVCAINGQALKRGQRVNLILRSLYGHAVGNSISGVHVKAGSG